MDWVIRWLATDHTAIAPAYTRHNFGMALIDWSNERDPVLTLQVRGSGGEVVRQVTVQRSALQRGVWESGASPTGSRCAVGLEEEAGLWEWLCGFPAMYLRAFLMVTVLIGLVVLTIHTIIRLLRFSCYAWLHRSPPGTSLLSASAVASGVGKAEQKGE
jgi:hypothetical protein